MNVSHVHPGHAALLAAALLALGGNAALAEKPPGVPQARTTPPPGGNGYFTHAQRRAVVAYYEPRFKTGQCPPGLAHRDNACLPMADSTPWRRGAPLPGDAVTYPVPHDVSLRLGLPPEGHRFVRVGSDILLLAIDGGVVIDAIDDLSRP
ncbi:MAG: hypothetical protein IBJ14_10825 [Hydrogenophaga sp.]|nr:hypothetical protein [Hydrogenophaga sp.]